MPTRFGVVDRGRPGEATRRRSRRRITTIRPVLEEPILRYRPDGPCPRWLARQGRLGNIGRARGNRPTRPLAHPRHDDRESHRPVGGHEPPGPCSSGYLGPNPTWGSQRGEDRMRIPSRSSASHGWSCFLPASRLPWDPRPSLPRPRSYVGRTKCPDLDVLRHRLEGIRTVGNQ
jgi:hypothetical protein